MSNIQPVNNSTIYRFALWTALGILVIAIIVLCSVPPVDRDALTHHLFVPKLWLQHGGIYEIPDLPFSYYPMNLDMLYMLSLYFGNDIAPKYIHFGFALLTGLLIYHYLNKRLGTGYALLGSLMFLSVPIIVKLSITVYVDLGLLFFTTAALLLLFYWAEQQFPWYLLMLAGLSCGLAAGTKYNGLVAVLVLTFLAPLLYQQNLGAEKKSNFKALLCGLAFALAALTSFSPWLVRNYAWTGNPIYPLHNALFQKLHGLRISGPIAGEEQNAAASQPPALATNSAFIARKILYNEPWWQTLLLPIRFFFEGRDDDPRYFDGKLTPFLFFLPMLSFVFRPPTLRERREQNFLLWFALLYFFFTFFQEAMRIRYIVAIVPPLTILSIFGFRGVLNALARALCASPIRNKAVAVVATSIGLVMFWYNGRYLIDQFTIVRPLPYLTGTINRDEYITAFRPEYPALQVANTTVAKDAKVLCLFLGNRGYYMDFQPIFEQPYSPASVLGGFLTTEHPGTSIIDELHSRHIRYILLRTDLTAGWLQQLSDHNRQRLAPLFARAERPLWSGSNFVFFALEPTR